jgi:hypothetical protein
LPPQDPPAREDEEQEPGVAGEVEGVHQGRMKKSK